MSKLKRKTGRPRTRPDTPEIEAEREKRRLQTETRRRNWFADKSCLICGSTDNLEIDHIDPEIKITCEVFCRVEAFMLAELAKCQVLCRYHHKLKTRTFKENCTKLSLAEVLEIRRRLAAGVRVAVIALKFAVSDRTIRSIKHNKNWKDVHTQEDVDRIEADMAKLRVHFVPGSNTP